MRKRFSAARALALSCAMVLTACSGGSKPAETTAAAAADTTAAAAETTAAAAAPSGDGVADGNTERAEQRNRTEDGAALFAAGLHRKFIRADRTCAGHAAEGELAGQADIAEQRNKQQVGD